MSNPFEKYFQATERQHDKINRMTPNWEIPASSPFVPFDTSLDARYSELNKPYTPDPTLKSAGDVLVDAAASALKIPTIIGGVAVGAADLALSAASKPFEWVMDAGHAVRPDLIPKPVNVGYGYIAKGLHDTIGYRPEEAKRAIDDAMFSDARKIQEKEYQSGYTAAEDQAFQDSWVNDYQAQVANLQKSGATEQQLKDFNTGFDKQYQEAATQRAGKYQTSWDKPLSENINIIGHGFDNLLENPSLALGGAIESGGYLLPSMLVSRGVLALEKAAKVAALGEGAVGAIKPLHRFAAAGVGEGSVAGTVSLEQMRSQMPDGIAGGKELLGAFGVAASTGLIGTGFGKAASKVGIGDVDAAGLGRAASQVAAMKLPALARPVGAIAQEGGEEFLQTFGESIIPNVTMGKDPLEGLGQELPMGTMAGAIMGTGMNAPSLVSGGFSDISSGLGKVKGAVSDAASLKSFETLSNPEHKNYNPAQAFNLQLKNLESNDETVRTQAQASVSKIETDLNTARASVEKRIKSIQATLKAMPTSDQTTDAQKLEIEALGKEYSALTTKSSTLADQYVAFLEAQVTAQEHRDTQQGTQFTEEQAKADIATLIQPKPSQTVWSNQDTDIPVEVVSEPETDEQGNQFTKVRYIPQEGADPIEWYVPTSELISTEGTNDVAQKEALDRVTRHFSKYSNDDLDLLATSPILSEAQRNSLRLMSESKRQLAAVQDPSQVFDNILNGYKGKTIRESHRGLNQYTDMVNTAVATKNEQLASLALDGLGAFTDDHTAKRDVINEAFGLVQKGTYAEVQVVRTQDGTWGTVPFTAQEVEAGKNAAGANYLSKEALNKVGGLNTHINSDKPTKGRTVGAITQINNETQLIQDRFNALSQVAESFVGATPKPVDTSTAPTVDEPIDTQPSDTTAPVVTPVPEAPVETKEVGFKLTPTGQYTPKDQLKADKATKFIGEGAANSSTAQYAKDAGDKANTGKYTKNDVVFISVNGARANRQAPNLVEIQKAIDAGATILTDKLSDRERSFNVGEREVAAHLTKNGYVEEGNTGVWKPEAKTADDSQVLTELNLSAQEIQNVTFDLKNNVSLGTVNTNTSRQTAQLGSDYTYSGKTYIGQPIPTHIKAWMDAVNKALGTAYNSVLVQYYPANTKSGIGFHKDNEKEQFDINQPVVSLSIGQTIPFVVHEKLNTPVTFNLKSGDVFKFDGNKLHGIASQNHTGERYSLTLRQFHKTKTTEAIPPVVNGIKTEGNNTLITSAVSGLTHSVPTKLVNGIFEASYIVKELMAITSKALTPTQREYLEGLLQVFLALDGTVLVGLYADLSLIQNDTIRETLQKSKGKAVDYLDEGKRIYIDLNNVEPVDLFEILVHEYHHTVTMQGLKKVEGVGKSSPQYVRLNAAYKAVEAYVASNPTVDARVLGRLKYMLKNLREFLTVGMVEPTVIEALRVISVSEGKSVYDEISAVNAEILKIQNPKTFPTQQGKLNDLVSTTRGNSSGVQTSSSDSLSTPQVESLDTTGNDTGTSNTVRPVATSDGEQIGRGTSEATQGAKTSTESLVEPISAEAETIYEKLGSKTATGNVQIKAVYQGAGVTFAKSVGGVFSLRVNGAKHHFGNPFSSVAKLLAADPSLIATKSTQESVKRYIDWVLNSNEERAKWIRTVLQSGDLKGKPIIYYAELGEPSHANALDYLINTHVWGSQSITPEAAAPEALPAELTRENAKLTVLQNVTDEIAAEERKKPFNRRNILKGYFTQSTTKEDATGANPLVTVKDFLKGLGIRTQVSDWLNDRRKPTQKQLEQVEHFKKFHAEFARALKFVFNTQASAKFVSNMENLVGYMEMGKKASTRELDENVVTALALSAYSYLIKQGNKVMNTNEELETLFRFKKGMRAPLHIEQMFRFAGQEMPVVVKALGTDAAKALGLKVREDQDPTLQDRLNTALGILAMEAMANAGFIVIETLQDHPTDEKNKPLTDFLTTIKAVRESKAHTIEDEYDFEVDTDVETKISKFTMVRPNAKMEGIGNSVFEKGIIETEVDGKIVRTETLTLNRPVLTEGLPTLNSSLVNELIEANKDTKGFLSYLFGVDVGLTTPLKEIPKKFSQKLINGTDASVPSVQAELLTEAQKHSFTMRTNTVAVFAAMQKLGKNSQFLKEVLGIWIDDHVLSRTHVTERDSLQAKAQNDWTAVLNGLEWADATLDENGQYQEFYDTQFVAQNQRQHLKSNMFSAQSSQIHRAMAALTGFSTTIDLSQDEQGTVKDEALLNLFYQAVGEGLEGLDDYLKADILSKAEAGLHQFFTVDKVYGDYYVPALKAFLQTTDAQNAIKAMRVLIETGIIDTTQQKAIAWFVEKGEMGAQSLQSLIALAELDIAQANGTTFTTTIGFGSDGVNHGVSASNVLTGVISKDMRQQTGIFPIAEKGQDQISNMQEVYRRKITDYYVDFGKVMAAKLRDLIPTFVGKLNTDFVEGMQALFPKFEALDETGVLKNLLAMRKMAKIWAIPFNYSAGKAALQRALARGFLAGIYGEMNKLANEALGIIDAKKKEGITAEQLDALDLKMETVKLKTTTLQDNLNKVLGKYGMGVTLPEPHLLNEEAKGKLSNGLENTLMQAAIDLHGKAAWQATEEFAKEYLQVRNVYTEAEKASFTLFDLVRNQLIEEKKASRKFTNVNAKVQVKGKTVQYTAEELNAQEAEYFGLTTVELAEVDAELAAMRPMFNTALSIGSESTNDAGSTTNPSGVSVRKHKMQREPAKGLRAVSTYYLKEIDAKGKPFSEARNIGLTKEVEENAGVAASANAVQSVDAFVAAKIQGFMVALNAHDNAIFGLKDFLKGVKKQNEEHLKALTNYQLGLEHAKMLVKVYQGYKAFMATQEEALKSEDVKVRENAQKLITEANKQVEVLLRGEQMFKNGAPLRDQGRNLMFKGGLIPKLQAADLNIKSTASIGEAIGMFIDYAINQDVKKLDILKDTFGIHQFAGEGGMHQLTEENRASIDEQEALVNKAKADLQAELKDKTVEQVAEVKTPETTKQVSPKVTTAEKVKPKEVPVKPLSPLVKLLRESKREALSIAKLIEHLKYANDTMDTKVRAAQLAVLTAITPLIDNSIEIFYSSGEDNDYEGYGFFDKETNTIHINSDKEGEGAVKASLVIHELLHAALANRIETLRAFIKSGSTENSQAIAALKNLDALRESLLLKITDPILRDMLKDTDEFISYGLTDSRLQRALLNTTVSTNGRGFGDNWRKFIAVVGRILNFDTKEISALAAFAHDTAALLDTIGTVAPIGAPTQTRLFSTQSAEDLVNGQSSLDIMQALPHSNTGAFNQQLDRLITEEIGQLYNQDDAAKARIDEIQTFTASDALNAGFILSRKEQYVQQALQYAVAAYRKLHGGGANEGQLNRVYHAAKAKIDPTGKDFHEGDWATATQQEQDAAKAKYDFLFDSTKEGYMDRFVSMALASESVSKILDIALPLTKPETQDKTWFEKVSDWVAYVMAWLTNKYVRLNPTAGASNQLVQLMENLVKLDIRARQEGVAFHQKAWNTIGLVTTPLNKALKGAGGALLSGVGLSNSRFLPVRALGAILVLRSEEAAKAIPKMIIEMRNNQLPNTKLGEVANILLEASGVGTLRDKFDVLIRQTNLNAKNRQDIVDNVKKAVNTWFKTSLTKAQHAAIAYGLLGTDAQALLENYSVEDIVDMALHEGKLNVEIAKLKKEIAKNPNGNGMLNAAEQLGYYMVTRIGGEGLVKNALGIAIGLGTQYFTSVEQADPKLVSQLNTLVSMLAMTHVPNSDKAILAALYKTDAEGVHAVIQLHQGLVNDSLKDFQANPLNMVKGWMPEVTNPYLEIKAANSMAERQQMEAEGWVLIDELKRDKHDKGSPKYLMKHNDIGYQRLVSGAVDLGSTARSGTEAINRTSPKYLGITQARYQNAARRAAIPNGSFDPSKQPRGLITAYDTNGVPLAYNYEMDNETRDAHLDRKHNIGDLLGTFGGLNYYKPEKAKQSNKVAEVLFEDYKANYSQNPNAYLKISHKSTDPKVVEMWRMLPQDFKQRATELYGKGNPIIIRNEAFNLAFGFKKFSVVSYAFDAVKAERERIKNGLIGVGKAPNAFQSGFVRFAEASSKFKSGVIGTFGGTNRSTAQADFAKAEHVTQEIVKAIKDFIVIRSGTTMMWNIFANVCLLMANGINPVTIIKDWVFAVTNVRAYQKLNSQLIQAQADLAGGKDPIALKQRIGALKAELKANVMNPYINAGLLSSIVEDVNIQSGDYTYNSAFKAAVDAKTQWIPNPVKTAAKVLTIAPSTKLYQFLATTTQLSDFVAKYSMSKHLQSKGMIQSESIVEASQTFINYDVPTSQGLQYANDMGLFMFTKFFLRIQAVLMKLLGKRAGSAIAQHLLVENLTGAEGVLSPMAFGHIDNIGIESSIAGFPSAFFSIGTVDAVTGLGSPF